MKTLQLWFSEDNSRVKPYMESVIKYTPDAEHYFVGPQSASVMGQIVLDYQTEMDKAYAKLGKKEWWDAYCTENMFRADMIRLAWALDNPDLLYADADVEFISSPIFPNQKNLPVMGRHRGLQEFFLFYVNGCGNWFQELIDYTVSKPVVKFSFMQTFVDIRRRKFKPLIIRKREFLSQPLVWNNNTFYKRHE